MCRYSDSLQFWSTVSSVCCLQSSWAGCHKLCKPGLGIFWHPSSRLEASRAAPGRWVSSSFQVPGSSKHDSSIKATKFCFGCITPENLPPSETPSGVSLGRPSGASSDLWSSARLTVGLLVTCCFFLILKFSIKLRQNKPVRDSNGTSNIPLMQKLNVLCFEWIWVNNISAITSWHSCEVETSFQCKQGQNPTNKTCSGSDAACMHRVVFKSIWLSSKSSFHNIFLCLCLLRGAEKNFGSFVSLCVQRC